MKNTIKYIVCLVGLFFHFQVWAQTDSLDYYTALAIENNPNTKSQKLAYEAYLQRIPQAGAFEDPEFSGAFYPQPMEIIGGRSIADFGVSQRFPWFGSRKSARVEASYQAEVQFQQYQSAIDELILEIHTQWYAMQKVNEQIKYNGEQLALLDNLEELATIRYSSASTAGSSNMSDVLRIRLEKAELENNIESLNAFLEAEKSRFNTLLNRDVQSSVNLGKGIVKSDFFLNIVEVLDAIDTQNPDLLMIEKEILAYQAKAETDKKLSYPSLGVGLQYMVIGKTSIDQFKMGNMNGKDMIMPSVSVSLPLFRKKYDVRQKESVLLQRAAQERRTHTLNSFKGELFYLKNQLEDAERIIALYEKQSELALTTYNLVVQEFAAGKSSLTNIIQVQRQLLNYQLKKAEAIAAYNTMAVGIEKLTSFSKN